MDVLSQSLKAVGSWIERKRLKPNPNKTKYSVSLGFSILGSEWGTIMHIGAQFELKLLLVH